MAAAPVLRELQRDIETQANTLSKIQKDIAKNHQVRKQYTIQLGENELVLKDLAEARANVRKRIEYISAELKRLDGTLKDLEGKQSSKQEAVLKVQQKIQVLQAGKSKS
ncbi:prefoldin subunit 6 [Phalaenopsis equestris]|uniref:prefoldin subunit 6 n=1 Tax=Phalaenopsis equestris TaxID=78828 RepID=UPI0009E22DFE|nr:prefoldin subunit 6 [Phalaenopsis equestris]